MSFAAAAVGSGVALDAAGTIMSADAAGKAAKAQGGAADAWLTQARQSAQEAKDTVAGALTPSMLASYSQALSAQEATVQRQENLAQSLEPALVNAGGQLQQLLNGKAAPAIQNVNDQRAAQKQQLISQLNQSGVGANSSAGMQQLQKFDLDTQNMVTQTQQNYIQQLSGLSLTGMGDLANSSNSTNTIENNLSAADPTNLNKIQQANAITAGQTNMNQAQGAVVSAAGGQYASQQILGQGIMQVGSGLTSLGAKGLGSQKTQAPPSGGTLGGDLPSYNSGNVVPQASNNYANSFNGSSYASQLAAVGG